MTPELLDRLRAVDTPTLCNAIEVAEGRRGFQGFTRGTMIATAPGAPPIFGRAVTAKIAAAAPSEEDPAVLRARRMAYYRMMAESPRPAVAVIEDTDGPDAVGAFWGEVNATVHKALGIAGTLTNGVVRDLGDLPDLYPILAGSIGPSHAFVRVTAMDCPVEVFGLAVRPGQWLHADRHGAVAIPDHLVEALPSAIDRLQLSERLILDPARQPGFDFERFQDAWEAFEKSRV